MKGRALEGRGRRSPAIGCGRPGEVLLHPGPVFVVVGDDAEFAAGRKDSAGVGQEAVLDHAVLVVLALGPGVGEVEVDHAGPSRPGIASGGTRPRRRGEAGRWSGPGGGPIGGVGVELAFPFDAQNVDAGAGSLCWRRKVPLPEPISISNGRSGLANQGRGSIHPALGLVMKSSGRDGRSREESPITPGAASRVRPRPSPNDIGGV